jgi:hypothetical protein
MCVGVADDQIEDGGVEERQHAAFGRVLPLRHNAERLTEVFLMLPCACPVASNRLSASSPEPRSP